mgnify:FL=1
MILYHITDQGQWTKFISETFYLPAYFEIDGFIHCSTGEQVLTVAEKYYADAANLLLIKIDGEQLSTEIKYENLEGGEEKFPHIYGQLNKQAIVGIATFERNPQGYFYLPEFL